MALGVQGLEPAAAQHPTALGRGTTGGNTCLARCSCYYWVSYAVVPSSGACFTVLPPTKAPGLRESGELLVEPVLAVEERGALLHQGHEGLDLRPAPFHTLPRIANNLDLA